MVPRGWAIAGPVPGWLAIPRATLRRAFAALLARDWLVLATVLVAAAAARVPGLAARAEFDGDQGHDVLTLLRFTHDGVFPLLGPPTSIGDFHHGARRNSIAGNNIRAIDPRVSAF